MSLDGQVLWKRSDTGEPCARVMAGKPRAAVPAMDVAPAMKRRREEGGCCMACCLRFFDCVNQLVVHNLWDSGLQDKAQCMKRAAAQRNSRRMAGGSQGD